MDIRSLVNVAVAPQRRRRTTSIAVVAAIVVGFVVWWWLPTLRDASAEVDVAVVGDGFVVSAQREISERVHEEGLSVVWAPETASWCDAAQSVRTIVARDHPRTVVVSFAGDGTCGADPAASRDAVRAAAGSAKLVVVENPVSDPSAPLPRHAVVVSTQRLLGPDGTIDQTCLWWDACRPDGAIAVRADDDSLTFAGQTRVARMIVTALH